MQEVVQKIVSFHEATNGQEISTTNEKLATAITAFIDCLSTTLSHEAEYVVLTNPEVRQRRPEILNVMGTYEFEVSATKSPCILTFR